MYIPTIFLGAQGGCVDCLISGSALPTGISIGNITSGSDRYLYIKVEANASVEFDIQSGITNDAKLLLVGGGGYKDSSILGSSGGGAGGTVYWNTNVPLQPNRYFLSASYGGDIINETGGAARFIVPYDEPDPVNRTEIIANGGQPNQPSNNGGDNDDFSGGIGLAGPTEPGGGGGAGAAGDGQDGYVTPGTPNSRTGGNGGAAFQVPAPWNTIVGFTGVAGGGYGDGDIAGSYSGSTSQAYGNGGASSNGTSDNGNPGVAVLFIPITTCTTSSVESEDFYAVGGSEGTFYSGSVQYKYHIFTSGDNKNLLHVLQGYTKEAQTLVVGGGAGSSTKKWTTSDGTNDFCIQSGGGAGAGGVRFDQNVVLFGPNMLAQVGGGGQKFSNGSDSSLKSVYVSTTNFTADGGGRGSYFADGAYTPNTGNANNGGSGGGGYAYVDQTGGLGTVGQGYNGGDGAPAGLPNRRYAGGGGGGAGGLGANGKSTFGSISYAAGGVGFDLSPTIFSFLTGSVFTARPDIAIGGSGSAGMYDYGPSPKTCGAVPPGGFNGSQTNDGSGANPIDNAVGNDGIVVVTYPISGSISNS